MKERKRNYNNELVWAQRMIVVTISSTPNLFEEHIPVGI